MTANSEKSNIKDKMMSMMPSCEEVTRLKSESMDYDIGLKKRFTIKFHMLFCQWCRRYEKQLNIIRQTSSKSNEVPTISLDFEAKARLKKLLEE